MISHTTKIIQVTDTHLFSDHEKSMYGVKTNQRFEQVIAKLAQQDKELIFLTGDISQDESPESYHYAAKRLSALNTPIYWIAGNHDDQKCVDAIFAKYPNFIKTDCLNIHPWRFIF
ncbi:metallophosphoesterase [Piscirickettsia litoralis]|uniref:Calcineurin-like phosphoesterase domain-containing protein n=1 Tax=Piscirickettsia litoralis TaxID=1891921 RepID=A0ABX2ZZ27_9GAMM|nr:metallophosphoesterase [Piscirickettsia litoralis]ODN41881.1 hypothetical protein BGC07_01495 [Piscirickettsia litoralis]